ncbi:MAG: VanZ family protein [Eubacteriales bacterium]|nr:VanZ family protein [Eubacteriales bacterium]
MENLELEKTQSELDKKASAPRRIRLKKNAGIILMSLAFTAMLWQVIAIYLTGMRHVTHGLLLIVGICLPLMLGTYLYTRALTSREERRKAVRFSFFALFVFYCAVLLGALIISRVDYATFAQTRADYLKNFDRMTNFYPLETIRLYINAIKYDYIGMEIPLSNLVGNTMLFMPMAVFLPCLFRPMQKLWVFALTAVLLLVAIEALQLLLACGSCDVDDILLNLTGTLIVFGILKIPFLHRLLIKLYLLPEEIVPEAAPQEPTREEAPTPDTTA